MHDFLTLAAAVGALVALGAAFLPELLWRRIALARSRAIYGARLKEKRIETEALRERHAARVEENRVLARSTDLISDGYELMKQVVAVIEAGVFDELMRSRIKAFFSFERGYLVMVKEDSPGDIASAEMLDDGKSVEPEMIPGDAARLIRDLATADPGEESTRVATAGAWTGCALAAGGRTLAVLAFEKLAAGDHQPRDRDMQLGIYARQLALGLWKTALYRRVREMAITDNLTRLYVPWYFHQRLEEECRRALVSNSEAPLIMCDVDHFKSINDTHGHAAGDEVLRSVSQILKASLREVDFVARYGGEEFAVILPEIDHATALVIAERVRKNVEKHEQFPCGRVTLSLGVATLPRHADAPAALVKAADAALYAAKKGGRNRVCEG